MIPHLFHVVQGGVYHKQSQPHVNPHIYDDIKTIRDHTHLSAHGGARFYLADKFPSEYRGRLFMCNIHEHAVLTDVMVPNGSSFIGKHGDDFMPTNDLAWVGFSVEIGPDGGVYILDWHDQDICGNAVKFPNSGRVYRIMPSGAKPVTTPNLATMSDAELVEMQSHGDDWFVRQARTELQYRSSIGKLNSEAVHEQLRAMFDQATDSPKRLRAIWATYATDGLDESKLQGLLSHDDPQVRSWAVRLLSDGSSINAFQPAGAKGDHKTDDSYQLLKNKQGGTGKSAHPTIILGDETRAKFAKMAREDPSPIVRLSLASAVQRMPFDQRWPILAGLVSHAEDLSDNNLARMYWFALEPMVTENPHESLELAINSQISTLPEFVARRMITPDQPKDPAAKIKLRRSPKWDQTLQRVANNFRVRDVGEGAVVFHKQFRNRQAVQTHPWDRKTPCILYSDKLAIAKTGSTSLNLSVSHHPHGDWQLRVFASDEILHDQIVGHKTVATNEWLDVSIDLSRFAGKTIDLRIENRANDWHNEWAYWNRIKIVTD